MKKGYTIQKIRCNLYTLAIILFLGVAMNGCKKDDNTNGDNNIDNGEGFRLREWKYYENGVYATNALLSYSDDQLIEVVYYDQIKSGESRIMTVDYQGDMATVVDLWPDGNGGFAIDSKKTIQFGGGNVTEILEYEYFNGNYQLEYRSTYTYVNDRVKECVYYYQGNQVPNGKYVNTYSNSRLVISETYNFDGSGYYLFGKTEWQYDGDQISLIEYQTRNDTVWTDYSRTEFSYQGNIIFMDDYESSSGTWELMYETEITLDANGNTVNVLEKDHMWDEEITIEFSYTNGKGNFDDIVLYPEDRDFPFRLPFKK